MAIRPDTDPARSAAVSAAAERVARARAAVDAACDDDAVMEAALISLALAERDAHAAAKAE